MSVPKANSDSGDSSIGSKAAGTAAKGAAVGGAKVAGTAAAVDGAAKGAAALGGHAVNGIAGMLSNMANAVTSFAGNVVHAITNAVSGFISGVSNFFGGAAAATSSTFAGMATAATVGISAVAGIGVAAEQNNIAVISDFVLADCSTNATGSSAEDGGATLGTEEQCRNAYIIYTTMYQWLTNNGQTNAENQSYGFLANVLRESHYNPAALESGQTIGGTDYSALASHSKGIGLVQWTNQGSALSTYFESNGMAWDSLDSQLALLISGNDPLYSCMLEYIANSGGDMSAADCNIEFLKRYEKPKAVYVAQRANEANEDIAIVKLDVSHHMSTSEDETMITDILTYAADLSGGAGEGAGLSDYQSNVNCYEIGKYDNSSIANAAVSFAWKTEEQSYNNGTAMYITVSDAIHGGNVYYKSCDRCVTAAVAWSGSDDEMATCFGVDGVYSHVSTSDKWTTVGKVEFDSDGFPTNCEPGDVLLVTAADRGSSHGHVVIYVGNETIKEFYPDADDSMNMVSASFDERSAACGTFKNSTDHAKYTIYRCVNTEKSPTYMSAGQ